MRYLLSRRVSQLGILVLFSSISVLSLDWVRGNLSSSVFFDAIPFSDPFAVLQILVSGHLLPTGVLLGAALVLSIYALLFGRAYCSWVCPVNLLTDMAAWLNRKWRFNQLLELPRATRWIMLATSIGLSAMAGVAAFEWISPIGILQRMLISGTLGGGLILLAIFVFDLLIVQHGWCGHLCPLGAFYSLIGRRALLGVRFESDSCTSCMRCTHICPEQHILKPLIDDQVERAFVVNSDCTNCGRCLDVCQDQALKFALKSPKHSTEVET